MAKFVKGEIVSSAVNTKFIGIFDSIIYDDIGINVRPGGYVVSCFINDENKFKFYKGSFSGLRKATKQQKDHFKKVLLEHGYSYYKGKIIQEL